jgi:hypothetical protein
MSRFKAESVLGANPCRSTHGDCVPKDVHRLDPDLELCVCQACGKGWMRDVDIWQKLDELSERLKISTGRLEKSIDKLGQSLKALGDLNARR